jgi:hypothetical protein
MSKFDRCNQKFSNILPVTQVKKWVKGACALSAIIAKAPKTTAKKVSAKLTPIKRNQQVGKKPDEAIRPMLDAG